MRFMTFIHTALRKAAGVLTVLLLLPLASSCGSVYEDMDATLAVDANLRLLFAVPSEAKSSTTQDYNDPANQEGMDNVIDARDLEVYFFTEAGEYITSVSGTRNIEVEPYSSGAYNPHYHMYAVNMKVEEVVDGQRCRVVIVANRRATHGSALPFCTPVSDDWREHGLGLTDEEALYRSLRFNFDSPGPEAVTDYARWSWNRNIAACVPMWGFNTLELKLATVNAYGHYNSVDPSGQIDMLRSIAKVRIEINPALLSKVKLTDYYSKSHSGGVRLISSMSWGYMAPSYNKVGTLDHTPDILNKDREGGKSDGTYTDDWINSGINFAGRNKVYPFFTAPDGNYYIYLPEHRIGQTWMKLEFEWLDKSLYVDGEPLVRDYVLHFADYPLNAGGLREEDLDLFPVMRNHYYVYTIKNLSMTELKYEVCEWDERSTEIEFN